MKQKYLIIALSVGSLHGKVLDAGDVVDAAYFPEENIPKLVEQGFIEEYAGHVPVGENVKTYGKSEDDTIGVSTGSEEEAAKTKVKTGQQKGK